MKQSFVVIVLTFSCFCPFSVSSQSSFEFPEGVTKRTFSFELINNLIVLPVQINGVSLSFLLDSGVNKTILFNNDLISVDNFVNIASVNLRGFSDAASIPAYRVEADLFQIDRLSSLNHEILLLEEENFQFSKRMGAQIDGIIGTSLFKDFKITVNYLAKRIRIEPSSERAISYKKCSILPIRFKNKNPLVNALVTQDNGEVIDGDFLIDSGSSDALWLFDQHKKVVKTSSFFPDFLGIGINGDVFGDRGKIPLFQLGSFNLEKVKVAYPNSLKTYETLIDSNRIGSIGGELLRRFKVTFDFPNKQLILKRNSKTFSPFYYNLSGIELQYKGENLIKEKISFVADDRNKSQEERQNNGVKIFFTEVYRLRFQPIIEI